MFKEINLQINLGHNFARNHTKYFMVFHIWCSVKTSESRRPYLRRYSVGNTFHKNNAILKA